MTDVSIIHKPFSSINIIDFFNGKSELDDDGEYSCLYDFLAPEASVMVVDDNNVNLTVAEGLLRPVQLKIEKAHSGKEALEIISKQKFDLILMDHMMPELDGVETTHLIRRFHNDCDCVPIIALTANAVESAKDMFLKEGLNDFIAKPIELHKLLDILKAWLPKEKLITGVKVKPQKSKAKNNISIEGLDTQAALTLLGSEELFWSVLKDYFIAIPKKIAVIKEYEDLELIKDYTIEVHALKSASKQIGATHVSMLALEMENAGNEKNIELIHTKTDALLSEYYKYYEILKPLFPDLNILEEDDNSNPLSDEELLSIFDSLSAACDDLDMDGMADSVIRFDEYSLSSEESELLRQLQDAASNIDVDACEKIISDWKSLRNL